MCRTFFCNSVLINRTPVPVYLCVHACVCTVCVCMCGRQMRAVVAALRSMGLRRTEVGLLIRRSPFVLARPAVALQEVLSILRFQCKLKMVRRCLDLIMMTTSCIYFVAVLVGYLFE